MGRLRYINALIKSIEKKDKYENYMREELIEPICTIDNCPDCPLEVCIFDAYAADLYLKEEILDKEKKLKHERNK